MVFLYQNKSGRKRDRWPQTFRQRIRVMMVLLGLAEAARLIDGDFLSEFQRTKQAFCRLNPGRGAECLN